MMKENRMPYSMVSFKEIMISLRPLRNREMGLKDNRRIASPMPILSALTKTYKRNTTMSNEIQILLYKWTGTRAFVEIKSQWKTQPYDLRLSKMKKFTCYKLYDMSILGSKNFANIIRNTENFSNFVLCDNSDYGL